MRGIEGESDSAPREDKTTTAGNSLGRDAQLSEVPERLDEPHVPRTAQVKGFRVNGVGFKLESAVHLSTQRCPGNACISGSVVRGPESEPRVEEVKVFGTLATQECRAEWPTGEIAKFGYFISS